MESRGGNSRSILRASCSFLEARPARRGLVLDLAGEKAVPIAFIHPSALKGNSPKLNFRFTEFYEVRLTPILGNSTRIHCTFIVNG